ncbi:MAG: hypothetical protein ACTSP3_05845 [Candidatus Heimdallarchaeaceae archaeon]
MKKSTIFLLVLLSFSFLCQPIINKEITTVQAGSPISEAIAEIGDEELSKTLAAETEINIQYSKLEKIDSAEELKLEKLENYSLIKNSIVYDSTEYWLLNFTYYRVYSWTFCQNNTGKVFTYNMNETFTITLYAFFPVILAIYRNDTITTDNNIQVITEAIVDPNYKGKAGILFKFDFEFLFAAKFFGLNPTIGPGLIPLSYEKFWEYDTPLDGDLALGKKDMLFPVIPQFPVLKLGASVEPRIDSDFQASLRTNDSGIDLSQNFIEWRKSNSIQSFSAYVPEFFAKDLTIIELFDFDMIITLNLDFFLTVKLDVPILRNFPLRLKLFSFPIGSINLDCENIKTLNIETSVTPSDKLPFVYVISYGFFDGQGNDNQIIEPGEDIDFYLYITNLGDGSALNINTTVSSDNVTVTGTDSIPLLERNRGNIEILSNFQFNVPSGYTDDFVFITVSYEYLSVNGTYLTDTYDLSFIVVDPADTYLEVSTVYVEHDADNWYAGDEIDIYFNVTNRGARSINYAEISVFAAYDTDIINPATLTSSITNTSTSVLLVGESVILGNISVSAPADHDDALIFLYLDVYYEDDTYSYADPLVGTLQVFVPKPEFDLISAIGYETDADGYFEAGETVDIEFTIENIGVGSGYNIFGIITSNNPDLNITTAEVFFADLNPTELGLSTRAMIDIPLTAINQTAYFTLYLIAEDSKGHLVTQEIIISIDITEAPLPEIDLLYYVLDDTLFGNGDGNADPGEIFFIYVYIQVDNTGFMIKGSLETDSSLIIYNSSSYYGTLEDSISSGDGFVFEVPLNYNGQNAILKFNITGESYSGRKITALGYIDLPVGKGDSTNPTMTLLDSVPSSVIQNENLTFRFTIEDPVVVDEYRSGLDTVILLWSFEGGEVMQSEFTGTDLEGEWKVTIDTSVIGTYEILLVGVDAAGNVAYLGDGDNPFVIEIHAAIPELNGQTVILMSFTALTSIFLLMIKILKKKSSGEI